MQAPHAAQSGSSKKPQPFGRRTLYDAVAGRLTSTGFLPTRHTSSAIQNETVLPAEEALYRERGAPVRYQENDEYFQHRHLTADQKLPDSDLLKIIHAYVADFYARNSEDGSKIDEKSFDETALLAMGILLEEAAAKAVGKTGHLALLETAT